MMRKSAAGQRRAAGSNTMKLPLRNSILPPLLIAAAALVLFRTGEVAGVNEEQLWRHRNLGKAFYENPTMTMQAVEEFKKALDLAPDSFRERLNYGLALTKTGSLKEGIAELEKAQKQNPKLPHTWFNLGIAYKKMGNYPKAIEQLEQMARLVPDEPVTHFNLGLLYNMTGKEKAALEQFRTASQLDPKLVAPYFQIYNMYRLAGNEQEAAKALAVFVKAKEQQKQWDESEDMEWCYYAEIYDPLEANPPAPDVPPAPLRFEEKTLSPPVDKAAGMAAIDLDGDGRPDLLVWSRAGVQAYRRGVEPVDTGLGELKDVVEVAPADFNNDALTDLCVLTATEAKLYQNTKGRFVPVPCPQPPAPAETAVWLDYDHDADLDLLLLGRKSVLLRNQGEKGFEDRTAGFPFVPGHAIDAVPFRLIADGKGFDLVVSYADRSGVLYRDEMRARYTPVPLSGLPPKARPLAAYDVNNDGWLDVAFDRAVLMNREGKLEPSPLAAAGAAAVVPVDLENRGAADLVAGNGLYRNLKRAATVDKIAQALASADFDQDGRADLAGLDPNGAPRVLLNRIENKNHWVKVDLEGIKNMKLAPGAEVEVKAGSSYQKKPYLGMPVLFGMGPHPQADTIRITWPNGMIQNVPNQRATEIARVKEAPRLSGSCPMVFVWNGRSFEFLSDVLGVAPLGASAGDGKVFPVDHDEYLQIPGEMLRPLGGQYEIRITEELHEVSYIDQVRLIAVDHPAAVEIYTNDKFKAPPFPEFRLFGVRRRIAPRRASDERGRDVLRQVLARDRTYPDEFRRDFSGIAEMHHLVLDFGRGAAPANRAVLILNGWIDWADGSAFLNASQRGGLVMPYLQVKDAAGNWRTVIEDMGLPSGGPKTIAVDLTGKFLSDSREVRIVSNLCLYWDEVFLSEETGTPQVRMTPLDADAATLRFRGFSQLVLHPARKQPEGYEYAKVSPASNWNPTPGLYTRYGDVGALTRQVDDRFVIMGSGDELALRFEPSALPALPAGWKRDFLLLVDGWSKDGDANTAFAGSVEPLPFHGMSAYPYPAGERYPEDEAHRAWRAEYNNRPALRLIQPLRAETRRPRMER